MHEDWNDQRPSDRKRSRPDAELMHMADCGFPSPLTVSTRVNVT
jgi:hypothetical protein